MKTSARRFDITVLLGLLLLATAVQWLVVRRAVTTSLDAVRYVRLADEIERHGVIDMVKREGEQPLFPLWIYTVERTISVFRPIDRAAAAQTASAVVMVLLVIPVYFASRRLVGRIAAAVGTLLMIVIPDVARLGGDATSDSLHLLFFALAFWAITAWIDDRSRRGVVRAWGLPTLTGIAIGVALLTRVESIVLLAALPMFLLCSIGRRDTCGRAMLLPSVAMAVGLAIVWLPYLAATNSISADALQRRLLGRADPRPAVAQSAAVTELSQGEGSFAAKEPTHSIRRRGLLAATVRLPRKLAAAFGYWIGLAGIWGAILLARRRLRPTELFARIFFVTYLLIAFAFCAREGYLESRHLMPLVVVSLGSVGLGLLWIARQIGHAIGRTQQTRLRVIGTAAAVMLIAALSLPWTLAPLHASRLGHRQAGEWLAAKVPKDAAVVDTFGWTGLYSKRATHIYRDADRWLADPHVAYLIVEEKEMRHDSPRAETLRQLIAPAGPPVARFPSKEIARPNERIVSVYRLRLQDKTLQ